MNVNKVTILGRLTWDPKTEYTPGGTAIVELGVAVNRRIKQDDEWIDEPTYLTVTLYGKQAENAGKYLSKGRAVYIEGRLQMDTWEDQQTGKKRSKLKIVGTNIQFLPNSSEEAPVTDEDIKDVPPPPAWRT